MIVERHRIPAGGLFTRGQIEGALRRAEVEGRNAELETGRWYLYIEVTRDKAGEEGFVYGWDLGLLDDRGEDVEEWIDGDMYFYSRQELLDRLYDAGIIKR